ncbi:hypothetical protein UNPF46_17600 [Bradyrhizobium sp. UNPF46]|uniref:Pycsar system effector family protein n=1 Tax=Bradyrhizobium sp. UNPF46 TaxID=1141168 RepID=UPI001151AB30|nr:Pycsar system effector family protein [Bradyrhizobium sp. UNPF46]TQF37928.1 hypothetical protein UNPF46_17600 [Bradyrhizobium sp. UNPF46]
MSELLNVWREINACNRFAETKLTFFVGILVGILGLLNSGSVLLAHEGRVLGGGDIRLMNLAMIVALVVSVAAAFPQLATKSWWDCLVPKKTPIELYYFLDIANFESSESWLQACQLKIADDELPRARSIAGQIHVIARIAARKFAVLRYVSIFVMAGWIISWAIPLSKYLIP